MKKRKMMAWKVMTTAAITSLLFSSITVFAEGDDVTPPESQMVEEITDQRMPFFFDRKKIETDQDDSIYKDINKEGLVKAYAPNDTVRLIVEVEQPTPNVQTAKSTKALYKQKQDQVIEQISKEKNAKSNAASQVKHRFFKGFNGFSIETEFQNIKDIQSIPGVTNVHIARVFEENMAASKDLVQAQKVWEQHGYKGEGLVVAVIDSGVDHTHKDMTLTDAAKEAGKWTPDNIKQKFAETDVNEIWYSDKVPTGYDWADNDSNVIPGRNASPHGTHVAGTIGANGDESKGGVEGVAPGVQLIAEKVFSDNGGGAYEDDIIAGIEHAVTLGADVINMSLGNDSGYVDEEYDPIQKAIRVATEQGTLVIAAAGNSAYSTKNNITYSSLRPYAENPDIGTVGAPGISPYALSVASYENTELHLDALTDESGFSLPFKDQTQFPASYNFKVSKQLSPEVPYDLVYVGEGKNASDYPKGKKDYIAVVKLLNSYSTVSTIQFAAKSAGAKAVIMIPPANWSDYTTLPVSPTAAPTASTSKAVGEALLSKMDSLPSDQYLSMKLSGDTWVENPSKDTMSDFSSMGTPHTLDFKPEISAPGGKIFSTIPGNEYEVMSGTSMAAPHVAGGSALLLQALYEKGLTYSKDTALKAKIALMNTAQVVENPDNKVPYSPRVQGSGLMQIDNAIKTPVIVTSKGAPLEQAGAVALKEMKGNNTHFKLNLEALKNEDVKELEYTVYVDVLTDETETKEFDLDNDGRLDSKEYLTLASKRVQGATSLVNGNVVTHTKGTNIKIKPGQEKDLNITLILPRKLKENSFVEGFVRLVPTEKNSQAAVPITVPYMGFYGEWDELRNIDAPAWEKDAFVGYTVLWDEDSESYPLGYNPQTGRFSLNRIAYSKNYISGGIYPTFQALRNLDKVEMFIEDPSGNLVKELGDFSEYTGTPWKFRKNIMPFGDTRYNGYKWDAKDSSGQYVPDGVYQYVVKTTLNYPNAKPQIVKMPITIDSVSPTVSDIKVTPKNGKYEITFDAQDNASDYHSAIVYVNGQYNEVSLERKSLTVNTEPKGMVILAIDHAGNMSWTPWGDQSYNTPNMVIQTWAITPATDLNQNKPANIIAFAYSKVDWTINVRNESGEIVDSSTMENEHSVRTKWTPDKDLPNGTYTISLDVETKDGFKVTSTTKQVKVNQ